MTGERLARADKRLILAVALIAAASITYTVFNYQGAFPEASIDLRLSKPEITALGERFLRERGLATAGFRNLTLFDSDEEARVYLEREVGLAEANRLMQGQVVVWRWRARWFRPPDQEEMVVFLSPKGAVTGFTHVIPERAAGARLDKDSARRVAESFLASRTSEKQRLIEEQLQQRPARDDYVFTWEQVGFRAKDATYRRTVVILGDKVGRYSEYLYVPEKWKRDYATLRSANELYSQAATALYLLLIVAAVVVLIQSLRRHEIRWRPLLMIAGAVGVLMVANEWNSIPFAVDAMPTSSPYAQSLLRALLLGLGAGVGVFFYVILAAAPGEPLYRALRPGRLSLIQLPTWHSIRTREFFLATVVGYGFAAFHIAFVVAFYLVGRRFGVWSPQDVNYSDFLSTRLPWIYPLTIALLAATSEEFWFRLLAIPLLKRYLRSTWLAVVIPAFLWGFLHANYPQQPGYIRGLEVGVIGVAAGFLMLRYGILSTLVWHYTVDAVLIGMFLFQSGSWYFRLSGVAVGGAVLFPLAMSLVSYRRRGGFVAMPELTASAPEPAPPVETAPLAEPSTPRWPVKWLYAAAAVAALTAVLVPRAPEYGDYIRVRITRAEAESAANRELARRVPGLTGWMRETEFRPNLPLAEFEYVRRVAGSRAANSAVRDHTATGMWVVRYFRPLQKEEWRVLVDQQGRAFRLDHVLDEKAPGANLGAEQARPIAESYLAVQGLPADRLRLVDSSIDKRDRRTDHAFVWEDPSFRIGEAKARVSVGIAGDEVAGSRHFLKLPEEWLRQFSRPRLTRLLIPAVFGAVGLLVLVLFIKRISAHHYHWRVYLALAALGAAASAVTGFNQWPQALSAYDTSTPLDSYMFGYLISRIMAVVVVAFGLFLAALAADVFLQWAVGDGPLRRPSLGRAALVALLIWSVTRITGSAGAVIPGPRLDLPLWQLPGAGSVAPALEVLGSALQSALLLLLAMAVLITAAARFLRPAGWVAGAAVISLAVAATRALTAAQFAWFFAAAILMSGVLYAVIRICGADLVTYAVALFWLAAAAPIAALIEQPEPTLRWNGIAAIAGAIALGAVTKRVAQNRKV